MLTSYSQHYRLMWDGHWWWQVRRRFVLRWLDRLAAKKPFGRVLDIGCGDGLLFDELKKRGGDPWGVEADSSLVDPKGTWTPRIRLEYFGGDFKDDKRYGFMLSLDSLEHIEDEAAAVRRMYELLEPGGVLFLTVPALPSLWSVHDVANRHFRRYTREMLRSALEKGGLRVEKCAYFFGWTVLPMYARKLLAPKSRYDEAAGEYSVLPPALPVNAVCWAASALEQQLTCFNGTPLGSSVFAVAVRPQSS